MTPRSATASKGEGKERTSPPTDLGLSASISSPQKHALAMDATIDTMPGWIDKERVRSHVAVKRRRSSKLANEKAFNDKAKQAMHDA